MRILFYTGRNPANRSGVSWKRWQIKRDGKVVTAEWGPTKIEKRRLKFIYKQSKIRRFRTEAAAIAFVEAKVRKKQRRGYQTSPHRRRT